MTGNKLRLLRELRNYSQEYVARKLGITQNTYSRVENNLTKITAERLHQLAQILNVPVTELVSREDLVIHFSNPLPGHHPSNSMLRQEDWKELLENTNRSYKEFISSTNEKITFLQSEIQDLHEETNRMIELIEKLASQGT